ncbi:MAG: hypothetical protein ACPGC9_00475 [Cytophagales bacterium]
MKASIEEFEVLGYLRHSDGVLVKKVPSTRGYKKSIFVFSKKMG